VIQNEKRVLSVSYSPTETRVNRSRLCENCIVDRDDRSTDPRRPGPAEKIVTEMK
jgi:hypothetical protein